MIDQFDSKKIYCRKLGHFLEFSYCRTCNNQLPCSLIADCWHEYVPVDQYLKDNFTEQELERIFHPSKPKMNTILDLIEKAKKMNKK
ncbi:MAG: hypothetical protein JXB17_10950 [Bacteroidales bacterium]|nr:hypothetical protein [Bacteroidales bacterium]